MSNMWIDSNLYAISHVGLAGQPADQFALDIIRVNLNLILSYLPYLYYRRF